MSKFQTSGAQHSRYTAEGNPDEIQSIDDIIVQHRDQIGTLQLKDATYRQDIAKLQKDNDYFKSKVKSQKRQIDVIEEQWDMDADLMLEQEEILSKIKGKYAKRDNPNEVAKVGKTLKKLKGETRDIFESIRESQ